MSSSMFGVAFDARDAQAAASFWAAVLGRTVAAATGADDVPVHGRAHATIAATTAAILAGASIIRVHDVRPAVEAAAISDAILNAL